MIWLKDWFEKNMNEIVEEDATETMKLLRDKIREQQAKISELIRQDLDNQDKLNDAKILARTLRNRVNELESANETILKLEKQVEKLQKQIDSAQNDKNVIRDMEAELERKDKEIEYYKKFTDELQCLPAYKKLLDNVAELKVPDVQSLIDKLLKLNSDANVIGKVDKISEKMNEIISYLNRRFWVTYKCSYGCKAY